MTAALANDRARWWASLVPVAILVLGAAATGGEWYALRAASRAQLTREVDAQSAAVVHEIGERLDEDVRAMRRMAARWTAGGRPDETLWRADARRHVADLTGLQAIEWVTPEGRVGWVEPEAGNEAAVGLDLAGEPLRRAAMAEARATGEPRATSPVTLAQGGSGILVFFPLAGGHGFDGYLLAVCDHRRLLESVLDREITADFDVEVTASGGGIVRHGAPSDGTDVRWARSAEVQVPPIAWTVRVWLPPAGAARRMSRSPEWAALGGFWLTILLAVAVSAAQRASGRKRALEVVHGREVQALEERARAEASLAASELRFRHVVEHLGAVFWRWSRDAKTLEYVSPGYETIWGRRRADLYAAPATWIDAVVPEDRERAAIDFERGATGTLYDDRRYRIRRPDGSLRWIRDRAFPMRDADGAVHYVAGLAEDVTTLHDAETMLRGEATIFGMVARHAPLPATLVECCRVIEEVCHGTRASILLRDPDGDLLRHGAGPSLSPGLVAALDGFPIAADAGACGTAAFGKMPVLIEDVARDARCAPYRALLAGEDVAAIWSYPLIDPAGEVLGTWALYVRERRLPTPREVEAVERVRDLATIAIGLDRASRALRLTQFAVDNVGDQVFQIAADGRFVEVNSAACRRLGYTRSELLGMTLADIDPDYGASAWPETWARLKRVQQWRLESHHQTRDGEIYPVDVTATYVEHEGRSYSYAIVRDITDWKRSLADLAESEERLRLATEAGQMGIWDWRMASGQLEHTATMRRLFGIAGDEASAEDFRGAVHPDDQTRVTAGLVAARRGQPVDDLEFRVVWPDGSVHWCSSHCRVYRDRAGRAARMVGIVGDIGLRKLAERERENLLAEVRTANGMLSSLSRQLLEVQENERRDLSRDLHDEIGQCLAAAKINVDLLCRRFPVLAGDSAIADTVALLDHILQHVSRLCLQLRPSVLDDLGLGAALRWYVHRQAARGGWSARTDIDELPKLGEKVQSVCFRTVQEALTNVMRHAQARSVVVELRRHGDVLVLRIADDGVGFDAAARGPRAWPPGGLGLLGMRERLYGIGGALTIESAPRRGTVIEARLPIDEALGDPLVAPVESLALA